jgi:NAD(P)-dependent dehydrogenase (short-subunit alcohol dehydrogenase family)
MNMWTEANASRRLDGQMAIVTGGGGAIGRAIALALHHAGAQVVVADLRQDAAGATTNEIVAAGGTAWAWCGDLTVPAQAQALVRDAAGFGGRLDLLVNNAGRIHITPLVELPLDVWRSVFAANVEAPLLLTQAAAALMRTQVPLPATGCRGKIINVSSPAAEVGRPLLAAYGASKAALNHLTKSSALVFADDLIAVTVLYPGSVMEGMMGAVSEGLSAAEKRSVQEVLDERTAGAPLGRFQRPEETASAALYIAARAGMGLNGRLVWSEPHVEGL